MKNRICLLIWGLTLLSCATQPPEPPAEVKAESAAPKPAAAPPPGFKMPEQVQIAGEPFQGSAEAPLVLVAFSDYQCTYCAHFTNHTLPLLEKEYIDTGKLKYVFRDLPYEKNHPLALRAAVAVHCAGEQKKFWPLHNLLFADPNRLELDDLKRDAKLLGLNADAFESCLESGRYEADIRKDVDAAMKLEVKATPTFFFGYAPEQGAPLKIKAMMTGSQPHKTFQQFIDGLLRAAEKKKSGDAAQSH